jgi:hypothetical protein
MENRATTAPSTDEFARRGAGAIVFAGIMLALGGILNVIYGIAAIDNANFFVDDRQFILGNLSAWGWATLIVGLLQLLAAASISRGGQFGRWFGMLVAGLGAIAALLSIPAYPFWSLVLFTIDVIVLHALAVNYRDYRGAVRT